MAILDTILGFFGIRRINLDKPLTLLGQYYYKVLDKIYSSAYGLEEDVDWRRMWTGESSTMVIRNRIRML